MSIGTNIRRLREQRGLTQEALACKLDVTFQAVSSWERDEYKPDTDNLIRLAEALDVSLSAIAEDRTGTFRTKDALYDWERMRTRVKTTAGIYKLRNTFKALDFAVEAHKGQPRKRSTVPYIYHPLNVACHAMALGILEDDVIAACLLHDVVEDCGKSLADLPVDDNVRNLVRLLTHEPVPAERRLEVLTSYYDAIAAEPKAALIKCLDRCNNLTTMSWGLSRDRIYRMIEETEHFFPALLKTIKDTPEYNNAAWLLKYQMESKIGRAHV